MTEETIKCPICGKPYKVYTFSAGDQSACPKCVRQAAVDTYKQVQYKKRLAERA